MKDESPVSNAVTEQEPREPRLESAHARPRRLDRRRRHCGCGDAAREELGAASASTQLAAPAVASVPGSPTAGISTKAEASTPSTAPRLLRK